MPCIRLEGSEVGPMIDKIAEKISTEGKGAREVVIRFYQGLKTRDNHETQMVEHDLTDGWTFIVEINGGAQSEDGLLTSGYGAPRRTKYRDDREKF